jgi:hypothetical protein
MAYDGEIPCSIPSPQAGSYGRILLPLQLSSKTVFKTPSLLIQYERCTEGSLQRYGVLHALDCGCSVDGMCRVCLEGATGTEGGKGCMDAPPQESRSAHRNGCRPSGCVPGLQQSGGKSST